jgi:hypothetical protein
LSGRIGDPFLDFERAMEAEHCHSRDSITCFTTRNYRIQTCAHDEWRIVVHNDTKNANMQNNRRIPNIEETLRIPMVEAAKLLRVEVIAVILYTGPMVWNLALPHVNGGWPCMYTCTHVQSCYCGFPHWHRGQNHFSFFCVLHTDHISVMCVCVCIGHHALPQHAQRLCNKHTRMYVCIGSMA